MRLFNSTQIVKLLPAVVVLAFNLLVATFIKGVAGFYRTLFRFLLISSVLIIPVFLLPRICTIIGRYFASGDRKLIRVKEFPDSNKGLSQNWLWRPLQGIGISMLFSSRSLSLFETMWGESFSVQMLRPFLFLVGGVVLSVLLPAIWALDDLGIRYYDQKIKEVRIMGKFVGILLPIIFGIYGILSLLHGETITIAVITILQLLMIMYPPYALFSSFAEYFVQGHSIELLNRISPIEVELYILKSQEVPPGKKNTS